LIFFGDRYKSKKPDAFTRARMEREGFGDGVVLLAAERVGSQGKLVVD